MRLNAKNIILYIILLTGLCLAAFVLFSCKTAALPTCKHSVMIPVVVQKDSNTFFTIQVPFCDTLLVTPKKIK